MFKIWILHLSLNSIISNFLSLSQDGNSKSNLLLLIFLIFNKMMYTGHDLLIYWFLSNYDAYCQLMTCAEERKCSGRASWNGWVVFENNLAVFYAFWWQIINAWESLKLYSNFVGKLHFRMEKYWEKNIKENLLLTTETC